MFVFNIFIIESNNQFITHKLNELNTKLIKKMSPLYSII